MTSSCLVQEKKFFNRQLVQALVEKMWIVLALVLGAAEPIIVKFGYRGALDPIKFFMIRNIAAGIVLLPVFLYFYLRPEQPKRIFKPVLPVSFLLMTTSLCTILALKKLSAITVLTVVTTTPALVAIINEKLGRDILGNKFWFGFWLCFAGVVLSMPFDSFTGDWIGSTAVLIAVFSSGFYRVKMDIITSAYNSIYVAATCFVIFGLLSLIILPFMGNISFYDFSYGAVVGVCAALANVAFIKALSLVGATRISIITMIQRPALLLIVALILREIPTQIQLLGIILVVIGMNFAKVHRAAKSTN